MNKKITINTIKNAKIQKEPYFIWDTEIKGFGICISPNGDKSYVVQYRVGKGRAAPRPRKVICHVSKLPLDDARQKSRSVISNGVLGLDIYKIEKEKQSVINVNELSDIFIKDYISILLKQSTIKAYTMYVNKHIKPFLGKYKIDDLTNAEVSNWHKNLRKTPYTANKALTIFRTMIKFGKINKILPNDFDPTLGVKKNKEYNREVELNPNQLNDLGNTLRIASTVGLPWSIDNANKNAKHRPLRNNVTIIDPYAIAAINLLIFTGARLREILNLKWEYVDLEVNLLRLPDSKTGKKTITLNPQAVSILNSLERIEGCPYVIVGQNKDKPKYDLRKPWAAIQRHANLNHLTIHDLRHTYGSYSVGIGMGLPVLARLLGHAQVRTTERYAKVQNAPLILAADLIGNELNSAMGNVSERIASN